jgi:hypothetical protein
MLPWMFPQHSFSPNGASSMFFRKLILTVAVAVLVSLTPLDSRAAGKSEAPGQAARDCAKIAEPKEKDDCVRAAREAEKKDKKGGKKAKDKDGKSKGKNKDKKEKQDKKGKKDKGDKKGKKDGKNKGKKKD